MCGFLHLGHVPGAGQNHFEGHSWHCTHARLVHEPRDPETPSALHRRRSCRLSLISGGHSGSTFLGFRQPSPEGKSDVLRLHNYPHLLSKCETREECSLARAAAAAAYRMVTLWMASRHTLSGRRTAKKRRRPNSTHIRDVLSKGRSKHLHGPQEEGSLSVQKPCCEPRRVVAARSREDKQLFRKQWDYWGGRGSLGGHSCERGLGGVD